MVISKNVQFVVEKSSNVILLLYLFQQTDVLTTLQCPLTLAQQLTHIELERLHSIGPEEFVQSYASESTKRVSVGHLIPGLAYTTNTFN